MELSGLIGKVDKRASGPLYQQLSRALRRAIEGKVLDRDSALPAEREIATDFGISRITVRKALSELVAEGLLLRRQGAGTYVSHAPDARVEKTFSMLSSFSEDMASRGRVARSEWLKRSTGTVSSEETMILGLSPGAQVCRFDRIRFADNVAMALEYSTVPSKYLKSENAVDASLYAALEETGSRPVRALQRLRAVLFTPEQAELLQVGFDTPGLLIERHGYLADGQAVEWTQSYYRGDTYDFVAELHVPNAR